MQTCTWAPTTFRGTQVVDRADGPPEFPPTVELRSIVTDIVGRYEALGLTHLLIAQRWWGDGAATEGSSLDCLAMTTWFASITEKLNLITAIHPGFFQPTAIAKWGATIDRLTNGRWAINVTSGWNMREFDMYGIDKLTHDERYSRSAEFIEVLRGAWETRPFSYDGIYYSADTLELEPRPIGSLNVYQGGQSDAAIQMASQYSDWMFMNGGQPERIEEVISRVRKACATTGRTVRFAMYAAPLCRATDEDAWAEIDARLARIDPKLAGQRQEILSEGAQGMWSEHNDPLSMLDTNEGYAARLIGSPETILERLKLYRDLGVEMLHFDARDSLFNEEVLPVVASL